MLQIGLMPEHRSCGRGEAGGDVHDHHHHHVEQVLLVMKGELAMLVSMIWSTLHYCYEQIQLQILVNYNICVIVCESII